MRALELMQLSKLTYFYPIPFFPKISRLAWAYALWYLYPIV